MSADRIRAPGRSMGVVVTTLLLLAPTASLRAQAAPEADPADVASIDAIIEALYDVISGPTGEPRDWDRMRSLFTADARTRGFLSLLLGPPITHVGGTSPSS